MFFLDAWGGSRSPVSVESGYLLFFEWLGDLCLVDLLLSS
jgi:hypothetical protein